MTARNEMIRRVQTAQKTVEDPDATDADIERCSDFLARPSTLGFIETMSDPLDDDAPAPITPAMTLLITTGLGFGFLLLAVLGAPEPVSASRPPASEALERPPYTVKCSCEAGVEICRWTDGIAQIGGRCATE